MTVLAGDFRDVGHNVVHGTVTLFAQFTRPSSSRPNEIVTRKLLTIPLVDGGFTSPELDPGPIIVEVRGDGVFDRWEIDLPEDGRHELVTLIETRVVYAPSVVGRVEAAAVEASKSATAAGKSASAAAAAEKRVQAIVVGSADALRKELEGTIGTIEVARSEVAEARREIAAAKAAAEELGGEVTAARDVAKDAASRAETAAGGAAESVRDELEHVRQQVTQDAVKARLDAGAAAESKAGAEGAKQAAEDAATRASGYATDAQNAAGRSAADRVQTGKDRDAAAASAAEAKQAAASAKVGAPETGWERSTLAAGVRDSLARADSALQSLPQATSSAPGAVRLAGDLAGTADAPRVQGVVREVDATESATSGKVVRRTNTGHVLVPDAVSNTPPSAAVSKSWVESLMPKGWQDAQCELWDTNRIQLGSGTESYKWCQVGGQVYLAGAFSIATDTISAGGVITLRNLPGNPNWPSGLRLYGSGDAFISGVGRFQLAPYLEGQQLKFLVPYSIAATAPMNTTDWRLWDGKTQADTGYPLESKLKTENKNNFFRFSIMYSTR